MTKLKSYIVGLAIAATAAVSTLMPIRSEASELTPLKIVLNRNTSNLVGFIAADQELYKKHRLNVELIVANSGAESNELLASERADGGTLGLGPTAIAWANGLKLVPLVKYRDGADVYSIIARKGSGISKIEDLKGKKVAVTKGTDPETAFILALKAHGLSANDVKILDAKWADHAALLDRGDIDAANANEPFGTKMLKTMSDKVELIERLERYYGDGGLMVLSEKVVKEKPQAAKALILAFWEAHKIIRDKPDLAILSLKKWLKLDDGTATDTLKLFGARPLLTETTVKDLEINVGLLVEGNKIRNKPDIRKWMKQGLAIQDDLLKEPSNKALVAAK